VLWKTPQRAGCSRFGLLGSAALIGRYTPPKAKYRGGRPIAHKYRKGKMQRTLKRESKELEVVDREAIEKPSTGCRQPNAAPQKTVFLLCVQMKEPSKGQGAAHQSAITHGPPFSLPSLFPAPSAASLLASSPPPFPPFTGRAGGREGGWGVSVGAGRDPNIRG